MNSHPIKSILSDLFEINEELESLRSKFLAERDRLYIEKKKEIKSLFPKKGQIVIWERFCHRAGCVVSDKMRARDVRLVKSRWGDGIIPEIGLEALDTKYRSISRVPIDEIKTLDLVESKKSAAGFVYCIRYGDNEVYKIGKTTNPKNRISSLKTSCPMDLKIIYMTKCIDYDLCEKELHKLFENKRVNREWFALDDNDIWRIKDCIGERKISEHSKDF